MSRTLASAPAGNLRACAFMLAAMVGFVVNDVCTKLAIADASAPQILAVRGLMATALLVALAAARGALRAPRRLASPALGLRALADIGATISYVVALGHMPIANASAIFQATPLAVTLGAAMFMREPVGWRRWTAILVGFVGILVIVRPGTEGFTRFSVLVLVSVVFSAARDLVTRRVPADMPSLSISAVTSAGVTLTGFLLVPFWGWTPVSPNDLLIFAIASLAIAFGYVCIVEAMRSGDMGFVAPFRYSILVFSILAGFIVFGDVPDGPTLLGAAIVVGSGGYAFYRERVRGRRTKIAPSSAH